MGSGGEDVVKEREHRHRQGTPDEHLVEYQRNDSPDAQAAHCIQAPGGNRAAHANADLR